MKIAEKNSKKKKKRKRNIYGIPLETKLYPLNRTEAIQKEYSDK